MLLPVGIEKVQSWDAFTYIRARSGSTRWAMLVTSSLPAGIPGVWLASWRVGPRGGVFWVVADDLDKSSSKELAPFCCFIFASFLCLLPTNPTRGYYCNCTLFDLVFRSRSFDLVKTRS